MRQQAVVMMIEAAAGRSLLEPQTGDRENKVNMV